jgi:hypothetical protein
MAVVERRWTDIDPRGRVSWTLPTLRLGRGGVMRAPVWFRVGFEAWSVGLAASSVIALRTIKILAGGPAGQAEARFMVAEKINAGITLQFMRWPTQLLPIDPPSLS